MGWAIGAIILAMAAAPGGAGGQELTELSAGEAAARIRAGTLRSEDLVRALVDMAERRRDLNAFITFDREHALAAARKADGLAARRSFAGPLHGVPIVIKDNIHVAGVANSAGTPGLRSFVPARNAPVAEKLIRAGAIVLGKTNMHELAFGITTNNAAFGSARNAYDPTRIAGGSSGGTGNAIAARMAPAGLGSDTGGSVRIPAALNGITGLRPTLGRYSQEGITPIAHTRDTAGPMAREVADLVLLDTVITGARDKVAPAPVSGLRVGVPRAVFWKNLDAETERLATAALDRLRGAGAQVVEVDMPGLAELNGKVSFPVALYEANVDLDPVPQAVPDPDRHQGARRAHREPGRQGPVRERHRTRREGRDSGEGLPRRARRAAGAPAPLRRDVQDPRHRGARVPHDPTARRAHR